MMAWSYETQQTCQRWKPIMSCMVAIIILLAASKQLQGSIDLNKDPEFNQPGKQALISVKIFCESY